MGIGSVNWLTCSNLTKSNVATFCVVTVLFILLKLHLRSLVDTDIVHSVVLSNFKSDIFSVSDFFLKKPCSLQLSSNTDLSQIFLLL